MKGSLSDQKIVLMLNDLNYSYNWMKCLLNDNYNGPIEGFNDYSDNSIDVEVLIFECGVIYISVNKDTLKLMLRGDLHNFPQIQIIYSPDNDNNLNTLDSYVNYAIENVMCTVSYANQILLSSHFSINKYLNEVTDNKVIMFSRNDLNDNHVKILEWYKKNAISKDRMQKLPDRDFILHLTSVTGFVTLTSEVIDQQDLENKLETLVDVNINSIYFTKKTNQERVIEYINQISEGDSSREKNVIHFLSVIA